VQLAGGSLLCAAGAGDYHPIHYARYKIKRSSVGGKTVITANFETLSLGRISFLRKAVLFHKRQYARFHRVPLKVSTVQRLFHYALCIWLMGPALFILGCTRCLQNPAPICISVMS
jgi:hypothetical protein